MMKQAVDDNMEALSKAILSEARAEADQLLADARSKADAVRQRAQEQVAEIRQEVLARARQEADRLHSQKLATAQLKARTIQLDHREKMLNQVFEKALSELPSVQQWTDYEGIAQNLLREALEQLRAREVLVRADRHTQSLLSQKFLSDISKELGVDIQWGDPLDQGLGVVVEASNGHLQYDNTLQTRMSRMQNNLRAPVYRLLMGEPV